MDFDGERWPDDARAVLATCREKGVPAALERSRSGNGAHIWFFFEEAVPAAAARKFGSHLLTETMERRPELGLRSYDRLFPNQDTLPAGGFGNLIALPLQRLPRDRGNSVFLDEHLEPHPDQWAFLSGLRKLSRQSVEAAAAAAERRNRVIGVRIPPEDEPALAPWRRGPSREPSDPPIPGDLPASVAITLADDMYIPKAPLPPPLRNRLIRLAAFQNPEFHRAQAMRLPVHEIPRVIACAEDHPAHFALPRGCLDEVIALLQRHRIHPAVSDERNPGTPLCARFLGTLRPDQRKAADAMLAHDLGVLAATTAFGKTVVAAWLIAARGVNTLVLVHRRQLLEQWIERLSAFLELPEGGIGRRGGGRRKLTGVLDVALVQSLVRKGAADDALAGYGHLVVDECHHLPARSFELAVRRARARFVTGLSATVTRKDGHHPIIFMACGPVRHKVDAKLQAGLRPFRHHVLVRPTGFRPPGLEGAGKREEFRLLCDAMVADGPRNAMIREDVAAAVKEGRAPLVLTERTAHLAELATALAGLADQLIILRGGLGARDLRAASAALKNPSATGTRILLATGRFIGEGFDDARLDTLFLAMPVSWRGTVAQYAGRLHRLHDEKREVRIYDYADLDCPMLAKMLDRRCAGYEAIGYTILLPASALPGWPAEVPLPVDPAWKETYSAAVRRMIRDGVDKELAGLFVQAAREFPPDATGAARARSASEAFLFRRLESLRPTRGRFLLNQRLPIPFGQCGDMEVDLLDAGARLVIEIDGPQHLATEEAWRRDRAKDLLLQRHGYTIMRFLAADVAARLEGVLDAILEIVPRGPVRG